MAKGISNFEMNLSGQGKYSTNMLKAAEYLAMPSRGGLQLKEIAEKCDISERQLRNWRSEPKFMNLVQQKAMRNAYEDLPDVMESTLREAKRGSGKHQEIYYKLMGLFAPEKHEHEVTSKTDEKPTKIKTNDELDEELESLKRLLDESKGNDTVETIDAEFEEIDDNDE